MSVTGLTRGGLAARTGCHPETVRYYEKTGLLPAPARTESGHRRYDPEHERRLVFIMRSRGLGFSLRQVRGLLDLIDRQVVTCGEVESMARDHLEDIRAKIRDLKRMAHILAETVALCSGKDVPECPLIDALFESPQGEQKRESGR